MLAVKTPPPSMGDFTPLQHLGHTNLLALFILTVSPPGTLRACQLKDKETGFNSTSLAVAGLSWGTRRAFPRTPEVAAQSNVSETIQEPLYPSDRCHAETIHGNCAD